MSKNKTVNNMREHLLQHVKANRPSRVYINEIKLMFGTNDKKNDLSEAIAELNKWAKEHNISISTNQTELSFLLCNKDYEDYLKAENKVDQLQPAFVDKSGIDKNNALHLIQIERIKTYESMIKRAIDQYTGRGFIREIDEPLAKVHSTLSFRTYGNKYDYIIYDGVLLGTISWYEHELVFRPDLKFE